MGIEYFHQSSSEAAEPHMAIVGSIDSAYVVIRSLTHFEATSIYSHQPIGGCRPEGGVVCHAKLAHFAAKVSGVTWPLVAFVDKLPLSEDINASPIRSDI